MQEFQQKRAMRPRLSTWLKHLVFLLITFVTCATSGILAPFGFLGFGGTSEPETWIEVLNILPFIPFIYLQFVANTLVTLFSSWYAFSYGAQFSASLLFILVCHEAGHYIACRVYGVDATLPYFIPTPPLIGPAGTLGAFIRIVSPMPSRKAVFDIGVAGPIAGFVALIPISVLMIYTLEAAPSAEQYGDGLQIIFSDPLLIKGLAWIRGFDLSQTIMPNPFYGATLIGLLVTALNLIPSGQLDGGHAIFAMFGEKVHRWTGKFAFVIMAVLSVVGMVVYGSPSGFLFAIILAVMMRVHHPAPHDSTPLDKKRIAIAILTLIIFGLSFVPFPITFK